MTYLTNKELATEVASKVGDHGCKALTINADSADVAAVTGAVDHTVATFGRLDILVNNAAVFPIAPVGDLGLDDIDRALATNVRAPLVAARAALAHLGTGGRIVTIGSNVIDRVLFPGFTLYALTKSALVGMTKGLARELGPRGITVNLVNPGPTDTDLSPADGPNADGIRSQTALGRYANPDEIAATVAFLAGADAAYVTGTELTVDGGFNI